MVPCACHRTGNISFREMRSCCTARLKMSFAMQSATPELETQWMCSWKQQATADARVRSHYRPRLRAGRSRIGARQHLPALLSRRRRSQSPIRRHGSGPRHRRPRRPHPRRNHHSSKRRSARPGDRDAPARSRRRSIHRDREGILRGQRAGLRIDSAEGDRIGVRRGAVAALLVAADVLPLLAGCRRRPSSLPVRLPEQRRTERRAATPASDGALGCQRKHACQHRAAAHSRPRCRCRERQPMQSCRQQWSSPSMSTERPAAFVIVTVAGLKLHFGMLTSLLFVPVTEHVSFTSPVKPPVAIDRNRRRRCAARSAAWPSPACSHRRTTSSVCPVPFPQPAVQATTTGAEAAEAV